mmetsp:Transcript_15044/g.24910  ORF Transcript_15044/g.24910 Transcript_15044/m.24910 type:complete len:271 (+) Transcript_15044:441-1253(+)
MSPVLPPVSFVDTSISFAINVNTKTISFIILPASFVRLYELSAWQEGHLSLAFSTIINPLASINMTITVCEDPIAILHTVTPSAFIDVTHDIGHFTLTFQNIIHKHSLVHIVIRPGEDSSTMLAIVLKFTTIKSSYVEVKFPSSMNLIVNPVTSVLTSILKDVSTSTITHVISPFAFINTSSDCVHIDTHSLRNIKAKFSIVKIAILVEISTSAVFFSSRPFTHIAFPVTIFVRGANENTPAFVQSAVPLASIACTAAVCTHTFSMLRIP